MKTEMKMIFPALLAVLLLEASSPPVVAAASTNVAPAATNAIANPEAAMTALFGDPVVARGKGVDIKQSQLDTVAGNLKQIFAARGMAVPPNVDGQALQALIFQQLILAKATAADRARGKELFTNSLQKLKTNQRLTDAQFDQTLEKQLILRGQTRSQWDEQNIEQATVPIVLERELNISLTDAEAKAYYTNHPADFEQPEKVRLGDILLLTIDPNARTPLPMEQQQAKRKKIEDLLKRARGGENFTNLAAQYSEDPVSRENSALRWFGVTPRWRLTSGSRSAGSW